MFFFKHWVFPIPMTLIQRLFSIIYVFYKIHQVSPGDKMPVFDVAIYSYHDYQSQVLSNQQEI